MGSFGNANQRLVQLTSIVLVFLGWNTMLVPILGSYSILVIVLSNVQ